MCRWGRSSGPEPFRGTTSERRSGWLKHRDYAVNVNVHKSFEFIFCSNWLAGEYSSAVSFFAHMALVNRIGSIFPWGKSVCGFEDLKALAGERTGQTKVLNQLV